MIYFLFFLTLPITMSMMACKAVKSYVRAKK